MGSGRRVIKALFGALVFLGVVWFLSVGILVSHAESLTRRSALLSTGTSEHWRMIGRGRYRGHQDLNLNYVSKRRVPNGPDPIHNRRVSQSRQPPGRF